MTKTRIILVTLVAALTLSISIVAQGALLRPGQPGGLLSPLDLSSFDLSVNSLTIGTLSGVLVGNSGAVSVNNGTTTQVAYWSSANALTSNPRFTWNNTSQLLTVTGSSTFSGNVGIGTTGPASKLEIQGGNLVVGGAASSTITGDGTLSTITSDLWVNNIQLQNSGNIEIGEGGSGGIFFESAPTLADWVYISSPGTSTLTIARAGGAESTISLDLSATNDNRTFTFPDQSGTFVLGTSAANNIAYWSSGNTLTGIASSTAGKVLTATETPPYFSWENHTEEAYGSLAEDTIGTGTGSTINATTVGAFYAWTGASSTISVVSGGDYMASSTTYGSTSTLTIGSKGAGVYLISMSVSFSNNTANQVTHCAVFKNNVKFGRVSAETKLTTANDVKSLASSGIAPLIAGDVLDLRCANETSNTTVFTVNHASLVGLRIAK